MPKQERLCLAQPDNKQWVREHFVSSYASLKGVIRIWTFLGSGGIICRNPPLPRIAPPTFPPPSSVPSFSSFTLRSFSATGQKCLPSAVHPADWHWPLNWKVPYDPFATSSASGVSAWLALGSSVLDSSTCWFSIYVYIMFWKVQSNRILFWWLLFFKHI